MRGLTALVAPLAVAVTLVGCGAPLFSSDPEPTSTEMPAPPAGFESYYEQDVAWAPCDSDADMECATVTAPLDWSDAAAGDIELAIVRDPADGGAPVGSMFVNPGGPGGSGVDTVLAGALTDAVRAEYDVIGWDPRGVRRSTPLTCFADDAGYDEYLYGDPSDTEPPAEPGDPDFYDEYTAEVDEFAAGCAEYTAGGIDGIMAHMDTVSGVRDLDLLRGLVGDPVLNYVGYSYGTRIGSDYLAVFPDRAGRVVLDGVIDPLADPLDAQLLQARAFERSIEGWAQWCVDGGNCAFGDSADAVLDTLQTTIDELDEDPLIAADGRKLWGSTFVTSVLITMYSEEYRPALTQALLLVEQGDPSFAFVLADAYTGRQAGGSYDGNMFQAIAPINCVDDGQQVDIAEIEDRAAQLTEAAPFWGPQLAYGEIFCNEWPIKRVDQQLDYTSPGSGPVLLVGTTGDTATPYEDAVSVADRLPEGSLLTYDGEQHTVYASGVACVDSAVDAWLLEGRMPADGTEC